MRGVLSELICISRTPKFKRIVQIVRQIVASFEACLWTLLQAYSAPRHPAS